MDHEVTVKYADVVAEREAKEQVRVNNIVSRGELTLIFFIMHENKQGVINLSLSRHDLLSKNLKNTRKMLGNYFFCVCF